MKVTSNEFSSINAFLAPYNNNIWVGNQACVVG